MQPAGWQLRLRRDRPGGAAQLQPNSALLWFPLVNSGEGCRTLNVWTPTLQPAQKMPVMVWIHGGGFSQGSGNLPQLNGTAIPRQDVVAVTINYRLAMFGFLAHPALVTDVGFNAVAARCGEYCGLRW